MVSTSMLSFPLKKAQSTFYFVFKLPQQRYTKTQIHPNGRWYGNGQPEDFVWGKQDPAVTPVSRALCPTMHMAREPPRCRAAPTAPPTAAARSGSLGSPAPLPPRTRGPSLLPQQTPRFPLSRPAVESLRPPPRSGP